MQGVAEGMVSKILEGVVGLIETIVVCPGALRLWSEGMIILWYMYVYEKLPLKWLTANYLYFCPRLNHSTPPHYICGI
jgi:hypothetical protein